MIITRALAAAASLLVGVPAFGQTGPPVQQAYLKPSNPAAYAQLGYSLSASGDTLVVGAPGEGTNAGAAYVFVRSGTSWSQQAHLAASNGGAYNWFGISVAVSGDTLVVGAPGEGGDAGAAYVFVRSGTGWSQQAHLKASNTEAGDDFGRSVSVSGDIVVVGAIYESSDATGVNGDQSDNSAVSAGAAYAFVRSGTTWSQVAYLKASNTDEIDWFGNSVSISGDTVVVGAPGAGIGGAAYVFVRHGASWSQQAYLKASNTGAGDSFGYSVSVSGDSVAVGAYGEGSNASGVNGDQSDNSAYQAGAAYVFVRSGTTWSQQVYLKASNTEAHDFFGWSVSLAGNTALVGALNEGSNAIGTNGNESDNSAPYAGAAFVFVRHGTGWSQQAYLKASNTGANDNFGSSVSVSGDMVAVGAVQETSGASGVNGNQNDNGSPYAGAAYAFELGTSESWADLGLGTTGIAGIPALTESGYLSAGTPIIFSLANAKPFSIAPLIVGVTNIAAPFKGGVMVPSPDFIFPLFSNFAGTATFGGPWPPGIPPGFTTYFQWWIQDPAGPKGFAASNALAGTTP